MHYRVQRVDSGTKTIYDDGPGSTMFADVRESRWTIEEWSSYATSEEELIAEAYHILGVLERYPHELVLEALNESGDWRFVANL